MSRVYGTCNTCGGDITKRQDDERHADEVWCGKCGIRFSLSDPGRAARTVDGSKTWSWTPTAQTEDEKRDTDWVNHMADLEEQHGGFPGATGGVGVGGHVVQTVPAAIYCLLATSTFKDAVELAVRSGGDCDTTAAITGAMAGTLYGANQVLPMSSGLECAQELAIMDGDLYERGSRL